MILSEEWKKAYETYLEEKYEAEASDLDSILEEMEAAKADTKRSFDLLEAYMNEQTLLELDPDDGKEDEKKAKEAATRKFELPELVAKLVDLGKDDFKSGNYNPTATMTVEKISDMKFPNNIIFFVKQLALWIRNVIIYFINKILNAFRTLLGRPTRELDLNNMKVNFEKTKKIEGHAVSFGVSGSDAASKKFVELMKLSEDVSLDESSLGDIFGFLKKEPDQQPKTDTKFVRIDLSKDLTDLKLLIEHFYKLFDEAFGTNNEKLFETEDLAMILRIFKNTLKATQNGQIQNVALVGSHMTEVDAISKDAVRDNLRITNRNVEALKAAYQETAERIRRIISVIQGKEMMMMQSLGVDGAFLSSVTYNSIYEIASTIPARKKNAERLAKELQKMKKKYEELVAQLGSLQEYTLALGQIQYTTVYQRRVADLFDAARDMTDVVSVRLAGVALYIKEMREVQDALESILRLNTMDRHSYLTLGKKQKGKLSIWAH